MSWELYQKVRPLGRGAVGDVCLCKNLQTGLHVAIKTVPVTMDHLATAITEVGILKNLHHTHIIRYHEFFMSSEGPHGDGLGGVESLCLVMEYAEGGDLNSFLHGDDVSVRLPYDILWDIFYQIVSALAFLERNNVLHRDIKPANIFLTCEGVVKLGDFGVSKMLTNTMTHAKTFIGTPQYMSPEVCKEEPYGSTADVWSCGVVLYEAATGCLPFQANHLLACINSIIQGVYDEAPLTLYPPCVSSIIKTMLQTDPKQRPLATEILHMFWPERVGVAGEGGHEEGSPSPGRDILTHSISWAQIANQNGIPMSDTVRLFAEMVVAHEQKADSREGMISLRLEHADGFFNLPGLPTNIRWRSLLARVSRLAGAQNVIGFLFVDVDGDRVRVESSKEWKYVLSCAKRVKEQSVKSAMQVECVIPLTVLCSS